MIEKRTTIAHAFDPELFRRQGHELVDLLADHLAASLRGEKTTVLPHIDPDAMLRRWPGDFEERPSAEWGYLVRRVLGDSNNLLSPRYVGHQCCAPLPVSALGALLGSFLNNGTAVYEMGPANVAMEKRIVEWMSGLIGWGGRADGVLTHGGTLGNLTAFLAALHVKAEGRDVWRRGVDRTDGLAVLASAQCHYSVKRAAGVAGLGEDAVIEIPVDGSFRADIAAARALCDDAEARGQEVFMIVANACSTATGSYDDLEALAELAEERDLWLHVDGAHGASALLSAKYRHLLSGIDRADSVVWDAHKMLLVPALVTAVLFKDGAHSYAPFSQEASYLFAQSAEEEWFNFAHRTGECTKAMLGARLYLPLVLYGTGLFADYVTAAYDLARSFAEEISRSADFELAAAPESNIVCFRYAPAGAADLDALQRRIRGALLAREKFYIVQTALNGRAYLRCTLIHPATTLGDLRALLDEIRVCAA